MASDVRQKRVEERIMRLLSTMFMNDFAATPLSTVLINRVEVSRDLRIAKLYFSLFQSGERKKAEDALNFHSKRLRFALGREMKHLKFVPELIFIFDEGLEKAMKMEALFDKIKQTESGHGDESEAEDSADSEDIDETDDTDEDDDE